MNKTVRQSNMYQSKWSMINSYRSYRLFWAERIWIHGLLYQRLSNQKHWRHRYFGVYYVDLTLPRLWGQNQDFINPMMGSPLLHHTNSPLHIGFRCLYTFLLADFALKVWMNVLYMSWKSRQYPKTIEINGCILSTATKQSISQRDQCKP